MIECQWEHLGTAPHELPKGTGMFAAFGDIHGHIDLLRALEAEIDSFVKKQIETKYRSHIQYIYLGDYVDRGPSSYAVVDHIRKEHKLGIQRVALKGNHEELMLNATDPNLEDREVWEANWVINGGITTIENAINETGGLTDKRRHELKTWETCRLVCVMQGRLQFLTRLPLTHRIGDYLFVHAGINPSVPLNAQLPKDLLWVRAPFLNHAGRFPDRVFVVHGHSPCTTAEQSKEHRFCCDSGAFRTGILTAYVVIGRSAFCCRVYQPRPPKILT